MKGLVIPLQKNRVQVWLAASVLLVVALVLPQLAWADHASDHPYSQADDPISNAPNAAYAALVEKYKSGELVYHAPGRRDDRSFGPSANLALADATDLAASPEALTSRRSLSAIEEGVEASSARWVALGAYYTGRDAVFLAENPEVGTLGRYLAQQGCSVLELQC